MSVPGYARAGDRPDVGPVPLRRRPETLHIVACQILDQWYGRLRTLGRGHQAEFSGAWRFGPLLYLAGTFFKDRALDFGLDTEFYNPEMRFGFGFFNSPTINRIISQCRAEQWIDINQDAGRYELTDAGQRIVLGLCAASTTVWWPIELNIAGRPQSLGQRLRIDAPEIVDALGSYLEPYYFASDHELRRELVREGRRLALGGDICSHATLDPYYYL